MVPCIQSQRFEIIKFSSLSLICFTCRQTKANVFMSLCPSFVIYSVSHFTGCLLVSILSRTLPCFANTFHPTLAFMYNLHCRFLIAAHKLLFFMFSPLFSLLLAGCWYSSVTLLFSMPRLLASTRLFFSIQSQNAEIAEDCGTRLDIGNLPKSFQALRSDQHIAAEETTCAPRPHSLYRQCRYMSTKD